MSVYDTLQTKYSSFAICGSWGYSYECDIYIHEFYNFVV
jgi:hypothetical protein